MIPSISNGNPPAPIRVSQTKESLIQEALDIVDQVWTYTNFPITPYEYRGVTESFDFSDRLNASGDITIPFKAAREHNLTDESIRFLMHMNIRWAIEIFTLEELYENHMQASDATLLYLCAAKMTEDFIRVHEDEYLWTRLSYYEFLGMENSLKLMIALFRISTEHNTMAFKGADWITCLELLNNLVVLTSSSLAAENFMRDIQHFKITEFERDHHPTIDKLLEMIFTSNL